MYPICTATILFLLSSNYFVHMDTKPCLFTISVASFNEPYNYAATHNARSGDV